MATCTHLDHVQVTELPESVDGCEECLRTGGKWLHLRICLDCGHVGLLRRLPQPARQRRTRAATDHPIIRSLQPGEDWSWCFVDELAMVIPEVRGSTRIPPSPLGPGEELRAVG